jgi:hypothetical protein
MTDIPVTYWKALHHFCSRTGADDIVNNTPSSYQQLSVEVRYCFETASELFNRFRIANS